MSVQKVLMEVFFQLPVGFVVILQQSGTDDPKIT